MKKIAIVGLGIIGGSLGGALKRAGYAVDGFARREETVKYAVQNGFIDKAGESLVEYDVVFIALPPYPTLEYLRKEKFKKNALVVDICGVKKAPENAVYEKQRDYRYVGIHPMAGKETSGIGSASPTLFDGANLIVTVCEKTDTAAVREIKAYAIAMGFGRIIECSAEEHDKKIALTSQLAHIVSNAYVKSEQVQGCEGFTGGSFQDMTRIAGVDETVWTPLYASNRENIIKELNGLIEHLSVYRDSLVAEDYEKLSNALKEGRLIRENVKRENG